MIINLFILALVLVISQLFSGCNNNSELKITKSYFGKLDDGTIVYSFLLQNGKDIEVEIIEYGAIVKNIRVPDKEGKIADIVLGYDNLEGYKEDTYYFGATIGRVANRMGGAKFTLNSMDYNLSPNTLPDFGKNHLHGGEKGFNKVLWKGEEISTDKKIGVKLYYLSQDGEEGYPGNIKCTVEYGLTKNNELDIHFSATTDQPTIINMTHHSYFNLTGAGSGTILDHLVKINTTKFTPSDADLIPLGEIADVNNLPVDFSKEISVGSRLEQMHTSKYTGYDLNYVLDHDKKNSNVFAAKVTDPLTGRVMEVFTTQPCMHFYTSNFLEGKTGKKDMAYNQYGALCFEPQGFPDAPNHTEFQSIELIPGDTYNQNITYRFSISKQSF